jgi:hypothetical protein
MRNLITDTDVLGGKLNQGRCEANVTITHNQKFCGCVFTKGIFITKGKNIQKFTQSPLTALKKEEKKKRKQEVM